MKSGKKEFLSFADVERKRALYREHYLKPVELAELCG